MRASSRANKMRAPNQCDTPMRAPSQPMHAPIGEMRALPRANPMRASQLASLSQPITDTLPADSVVRPPDSIQKAAFRFLDSVFSRPEFQFQIAQPDIPADLQPILIRFNNAIVANHQWFLAYRNKYVASGQPLPYNERFGITPQEYQRLQHMEAEPPQLVAIDSQQVKVLRDAGFVHFRSEGGSHLIDYLLIDSQGRQLLYGSDTLPLIGRTNTGPSSPYGQWQGFTWRTQKTDVAGTIDAGQLTARVIEVNLGLPQEGKKTFLRIKYQDIRSGITTANLELLGFIR